MGKNKKDACQNSDSDPEKVPEKDSNKKGKKIDILTQRIKLPKGLKYVIKNIPSHSLRFGTSYNSTFMADFLLSIREEGIALFRQTIFGPYLNITQCNFQGQITKCLLLLQLVHKNSNELHIRHIQGNVLHFTIKEFAIITGLKCTGNVTDFSYTDSPPSRLLRRYFPDARSGINKGLLVQRFLEGNWDSNQDAVQMAILYFIHTFIFSQLGDSSVSVDDFRMVEDGSYAHYPWGQLAYNKLMRSMRQEFTTAKQLYRLGGMPYALNVWMYECASKVHPDIAVREGNLIPQICNWRVVGVKSKYEMFMSTMFSEDACNDIVPTPEELAAFDIPNIEGQDAAMSIPTTSAVTRRQAVTEDVSGFEEFSTKPPETLLKRSRRSLPDISSSPPSKRKRNVRDKRQAYPDANIVEKTVKTAQISIDQVSISVFPHSTAGPSDSLPKSPNVHHEQPVNNKVETLKKHLMDYMDRKFEGIENLIKENHNVLLKALAKEELHHSKGPSITDKDDVHHQPSHDVEIKHEF